jgi:hypothetical protein
MGVVRVIVILLRAFLLPRAALAAENLALRQQLGVLQRSVMADGSRAGASAMLRGSGTRSFGGVRQPRTSDRQAEALCAALQHSRVAGTVPGRNQQEKPARSAGCGRV